MSLSPLLTYIINLEKRLDRRIHVLKQFQDKPEFAIQLVYAKEYRIGAVGLWMTVKKIIECVSKTDVPYILIVEDDHLFTETYSKETLFNAINTADNRAADILLGGVSAAWDIIDVGENLCWTSRFSGTQFMIIYNRFFDKLLNENFAENDSLDYKLCDLSEHIYIMHPFISMQKEFGYSDVTHLNSQKGKVELLFRAADNAIKAVKTMQAHYATLDNHNIEIVINSKDFIIPVYVINLPERSERLQHILGQFKDKDEFDVKIIEACKHEVGALGLWLSIRKIIQLAKDNEDDVIVICEDDHEFTKEYSADYLLRNILTAHSLGINYLSGGTAGFDNAIPVCDNLVWTNPSSATQFIIVYSNFYDKILVEPYDESVIADILLSEMTCHKMTLFPFISVQKDFGHSDVTSIHNAVPGLVTKMFRDSSDRLERICECYKIIKK